MVNTSQRPYRDADNKTNVLPLLYYENSWFRFLGNTAAVKAAKWRLGSDSSISLEAIARYDGSGYDEDDASALDGMDERKGGFWGGGAAIWDNPVARVSATWLADLSNKSDGQIFELKLDHRFEFGRFSLTPRVQAQWLNGNYVDYYFGVRADEVLPGRPRYQGHSALTPGLGLRLDYRFNPHHSVFLDLSVTKLPDEIKNSPIVGRSSVSRATVGYLYRF